MDKVILTLAIISILFGVSQQAKLESRSSALDMELEEDTDSVEFLGKKASVENIFKDIWNQIIKIYYLKPKPRHQSIVLIFNLVPLFLQCIYNIHAKGGKGYSRGRIQQ